MTINFDAFLATLPLMGKGMFGIFLITLVIIGGITLLNRLFSRKDKNDQ